MKELTYNDWLKNPVPRNMWVWDNSEELKEQRKVVYFLKPGISFPIVALSDGETGTENFKHCAELEKQRRMTNKELSRWLREKPTREYKYNSYIACSIYSSRNYTEDSGDKEVNADIVIREDDGEWREPLVEVKDD